MDNELLCISGYSTARTFLDGPKKKTSGGNKSLFVMATMLSVGCTFDILHKLLYTMDSKKSINCPLTFGWPQRFHAFHSNEIKSILIIREFTTSKNLYANDSTALLCWEINCGNRKPQRQDKLNRKHTRYAQPHEKYFSSTRCGAHFCW